MFKFMYIAWPLCYVLYICGGINATLFDDECLFTVIYIYKHICVCAYIFMRVCVRVWECVFLRLYLCMCTCSTYFPRIHTYMCVCVCAGVY